LLDITTRHISGVEAIRAAFVVGSGETVPGGSWTTLSKASSKGAKDGKKG
jgi:hypothetical protein